MIVEGTETASNNGLGPTEWPPGNAEPGREVVPIGIPHLRTFETGIGNCNEHAVFDVPSESLCIFECVSDRIERSDLVNSLSSGQIQVPP